MENISDLTVYSVADVCQLADVQPSRMEDDWRDYREDSQRFSMRANYFIA